MFKNAFLSLLILVLSLSILSCSDDGSNPAEPVPESVGTYEGTNTMDKPVSITISNISGTPWVTSYSIEYEMTVSGSSYSGTASQTNSEGLVKVVGEKFELSIGSENTDILMGTLDGDKITGTFNLHVIPGDNAVYAAGSFTLTKN